MPTEKQWDKMRDDKQVNIQTLACLNKAVDLVIAANSVDKLSQGALEEKIENWTAILFKIGTDKRNQEIMNTLESTKSQEAVKKQEDYEERSKLEDTKRAF